MSHRVKLPADPAARAEATSPATPATYDQVPAADSVAAGSVGALGGGGLPEPRRFGRVQVYQAVLALQRTHGNSAVLRMLARAAGAGGRGTAVRRHTSVELEEPENAIKRQVIQRLVIQRDLATNLSQAMSIGVAGMPMIVQAIPAASADDRRAVLNNLPLLAELKAWLPRSTMVSVLSQLGAPLADQLDVAMEGAGAAAADVLAAIENPTTPVAQKRLVLRNPELMARLLGRLNQDAAIRAMRGLGASLTEQLNAAMEDALYGLIPANEDAILKPIATAPPDQKLAAVRDRALVGRLAGKLSLSNMLRALEGLGASPADRLNTVLDRADLDTDAIDKLAASATEAQRQEILDNTALVARLSGKLSPPVMQGVLSRLGASLADQLRLALDAGEADAPWTLAMVEAADKPERELVRENSALVGRLQSAMSAPVFERVGVLVGLPLPVAAGSSTPMTLGGGAPKAWSDRAGELDPAEPQTLVGEISAALDQAPPDIAAAFAAIAGATPDELTTVRRDATLRDRLYAGLDQAQLLKIMTLLGVGLPSRLATLLDRTAGFSDIHAHVVGATAAEKRSVLDDRALVERLVAFAGEPGRTMLLGALGDTLGNQIDQLLAGTATPTALGNLIRGATQAARDEVSGNSALMGRIAAAFSPYEVFRTQVLLLYGNEAAYPGPVMSLVFACTNPVLWAVRAPLGNLSDADLAKIKTPVREYLRPRLSEADFATLGRILDQGLIADETIEETWKETLQADYMGFPNFLFVPREFVGTRGFDVAYYRDRVQVVVRIQFEPFADDVQAKQALPAQMAAWETMIEAAWDNKFSLRNAARTLPIRIDMVPNSGSPHHHVNVGSAINVPWPGFNLSNWFYQATNYNLANAPLHEFGHMLGHEDEYDRTPVDYQRVVGTAAATDPDTTHPSGLPNNPDIAGNQRFTNYQDVMGSPQVGAGTVERRHLNYFTNWINNHLQAGEPAYTLI